MPTKEMRLRAETGPQVVRLAGDGGDVAADFVRRLLRYVVADAVTQIAPQVANVLRRRRHQCLVLVSHLLVGKLTLC